MAQPATPSATNPAPSSPEAQALQQEQAVYETDPNPLPQQSPEYQAQTYEVSKVATAKGPGKYAGNPNDLQSFQDKIQAKYSSQTKWVFRSESGGRHRWGLFYVGSDGKLGRRVENLYTFADNPNYVYRSSNFNNGVIDTTTIFSPSGNISQIKDRKLETTTYFDYDKGTQRIKDWGKRDKWKTKVAALKKERGPGKSPIRNVRQDALASLWGDQFKDERENKTKFLWRNQFTDEIKILEGQKSQGIKDVSASAGLTVLTGGIGGSSGSVAGLSSSSVKQFSATNPAIITDPAKLFSGDTKGIQTSGLGGGTSIERFSSYAGSESVSQPLPKENPFGIVSAEPDKYKGIFDNVSFKPRVLESSTDKITLGISSPLSSTPLNKPLPVITTAYNPFIPSDNKIDIGVKDLSKAERTKSGGAPPITSKILQMLSGGVKSGIDKGKEIYGTAKKFYGDVAEVGYTAGYKLFTGGKVPGRTSRDIARTIGSVGIIEIPTIWMGTGVAVRGVAGAAKVAFPKGSWQFSPFSGMTRFLEENKGPVRKTLAISGDTFHFAEPGYQVVTTSVAEMKEGTDTSLAVTKGFTAGMKSAARNIKIDMEFDRRFMFQNWLKEGWGVADISKMGIGKKGFVSAFYKVKMDTKEYVAPWLPSSGMADPKFLRDTSGMSPLKWQKSQYLKEYVSRKGEKRVTSFEFPGWSAKASDVQITADYKKNIPVIYTGEGAIDSERSRGGRSGRSVRLLFGSGIITTPSITPLTNNNRYNDYVDSEHSTLQGIPVDTSPIKTVKLSDLFEQNKANAKPSQPSQIDFSGLLQQQRLNLAGWTVTKVNPIVTPPIDNQFTFSPPTGPGSGKGKGRKRDTEINIQAPPKDTNVKLNTNFNQNFNQNFNTNFNFNQNFNVNANIGLPDFEKKKKRKGFKGFGSLTGGKIHKKIRVSLF